MNYPSHLIALAKAWNCGEDVHDALYDALLELGYEGIATEHFAYNPPWNKECSPMSILSADTLGYVHMEFNGCSVIFNILNGRSLL